MSAVKVRINTGEEKGLWLSQDVATQLGLSVPSDSKLVVARWDSAHVLHDGQVLSLSFIDAETQEIHRFEFPLIYIFISEKRNIVSWDDLGAAVIQRYPNAYLVAQFCASKPASLSIQQQSL